MVREGGDVGFLRVQFYADGCQPFLRYFDKSFECTEVVVENHDVVRKTDDAWR